ncbi:hypothetical protein F9U64_15230 [Gracilibacillus oryzae]|uniref:Prenyltransferase n=1 Tax=Gracilibacillus oryzae TaxID=1672701 RepID=A0A7C8L5W0_9BACI|nr:hypothetical protein [Gracilibacillus oryzae]KAB8129360.1 hypothetical protein F9U64_15230 [Gracilibacillus oryzae]
MMISKETFKKTSDWMKRNARPLEAARWDYLFNGNNKEGVMRVLQAYQNDDGGFGQGIEPDFWLPSSSSIASWFAGQILLEVEASKDDEMVAALIDYLVDTCNRELGLWVTVLPENNDYPHAPWWHWEENVQENWMYNPTAELAGLLLYWSEEQSEAFLLANEVLGQALRRLMEAEQMDFHEINNYQQLYKIISSKGASTTDRLSYTLDQIFTKISALIDDSVEKDISLWATGYRPLPLTFAVSPEDPFYHTIDVDLIEANLLFYRKQMNDEGIWNIAWDWRQFPEEFPVARRYWEGIQAINRYKIIKSFHWLE